MSELILDFTDAWLDFRFLELQEVIALSERLLEGEATVFETRVAAEAERLSPAEREEFYAYITEEYCQIHESFPSVLRRARMRDSRDYT